jgi:hypothetical protein
MTPEKVKAKIAADIRKLDKEQEAEQKKASYKSGKSNNAYLLAYIITRKKTLQEVLNMMD